MVETNVSLQELETNDCTVRAVSHAFNIPYKDAHEICAKYGREFGQGFQFQAKLATDLRLKPRMEYFGLTVNKLLKVIQNGTFMCLVKGHVFCIKDKVRMDGRASVDVNKVIRLWEIPTKGTL